MDSVLNRLEKVAKLEKDGNWHEMLVFCQEWVSENPRYPGAWHGIGDSLRKLGNPAEAILMYRKALEMAITYSEDSTGDGYDAAPLWYQLGHAYSESGAPQQAVEAFLEATIIDPDITDIWNDLGVVYMNMNPRNTQAAFNAFGKAFALEPKNVNTLKNLGIVYAMAGSEPGIHQIHKLLSDLDERKAESFLLQAKEIMSNHK